MAFSKPGLVILGPGFSMLPVDIDVGEFTEHIHIMLDVNFKLPPLMCVLDRIRTRTAWDTTYHLVHTHPMFEDITALPPSEVYIRLVEQVIDKQMDLLQKGGELVKRENYDKDAGQKTTR